MAELSQIRKQAEITREKLKICVKEINGKSIEYTLCEGIVQYMTDFDISLSKKFIKNANVKNQTAIINTIKNNAMKNAGKELIERGEHIFKYFEKDLCTTKEVFEFCKSVHEESARLLYNNFMTSIANDYYGVVARLNESTENKKQGK